jgi:hypothetical protein
MRAKFKCGTVEGPKEINQWLSDIHGTGKRDTFNVTLYPVSGGSPENDSFFASTPSGKLELSTVNPGAADYFKVNKEYYIDFTVVE